MKHNSELTPLAQKLRKEMTKEEKQLWYHFLRHYPVQFRRQVTCGQYIVDFYCAKAKLVVELDGSQHFDPVEMKKDAIRTNYLNSLWLRVLRISNNEIWKNLGGVCDQIDYEVRSRVC